MRAIHLAIFVASCFVSFSPSAGAAGGFTPQRVDTGHSVADLLAEHGDLGRLETGLVSGELRTHSTDLLILSTGFAPSIAHFDGGFPLLNLGAAAARCEHDAPDSLPREACPQEPVTADDGLELVGCGRLIEGEDGEVFELRLKVSFVSDSTWGLPASLYTGRVRL
ncbi:MAG: hypothetical protein AAF533_24015, partial [Acidobacteriota bacterium]